jgi:hypothetical protein
MSQSGQIVGDVQFRPGDGANMPIPRGRVEIEPSQAEVTLSWVDGETHGAATLPLNEFKRYVSEGAIQLDRA